MKVVNKTKLFLLLFLSVPSISMADMVIKPVSDMFTGAAAVAPQEKIKELLREELLKNNISESVKIDIKGQENGIALKEMRPSYDVSVDNIELNEKIRKFTATIAFKDGDYREDVELTGRYDELVSIPVLGERKQYKTVVTPSDITHMEVLKSSLTHETITDEKQLVGMVLKRSVREMKPIKVKDLIREQIIEKDKVINMVYKTPFVTLKTSGIAMENGARGDMVRVRNTASNKIVKAKIEDVDMVVVSSENL